MDSATILTPLAPAQAIPCFSSEPNIPEGPEHEKKMFDSLLKSKGVLRTCHI